MTANNSPLLDATINHFLNTVMQRTRTVAADNTSGLDDLKPWLAVYTTTVELYARMATCDNEDFNEHVVEHFIVMQHAIQRFDDVYSEARLLRHMIRIIDWLSNLV